MDITKYIIKIIKTEITCVGMDITKYIIKIIKTEIMNRVYIARHLFIYVGTKIHYSLLALFFRYFLSVTKQILILEIY